MTVNFCSQCGSSALPSNKFCSNCGMEISRTDVAVSYQNLQEEKPESVPSLETQSTNLLDKPMYWIIAAVCFVVGFWFGDYGIISLTKGNCDFVYFNSGQFPSTSNSFVCVSNVEVDAVSALGTNVYGHVPFSIAMQAASIFFVLLGWIFVRKARLQP